MALAQKTTYTITGFSACPCFHKALAAVKEYSEANPDKIDFDKIEFSGRPDYNVHREKVLQDLGKSTDFHKTCPLIYTTDLQKPRDFIGGCDDFLAHLSNTYKK